MLRFAVCIVLATVAFGRTLNFDAEWVKFKVDYKREYKNGEEEMRRRIFQENLDYINKHNSEGHTFTLGVNQFTDMTNKEFLARMNDFVEPPKKFGTNILKAPKSVQDLPAEVDWRKKGYVTAVKNTFMCDGDWAFAATGALEGQHFNKTGKLVSLSEQNLIDCSKQEGTMGCQGGFANQAFEYIKNNKGVDTEASYPFTGMEQSQCYFKSKDIGATLTGYVDIQQGNESALQVAVATVGPISASFVLCNGLPFQSYSSGIYIEPKCDHSGILSFLLIVGYGTSDGQPYWLAKNCWGTGWGIDGYMMLARNHNNMMNIASGASYPTV